MIFRRRAGALARRHTVTSGIRMTNTTCMQSKVVTSSCMGRIVKSTTTKTRPFASGFTPATPAKWRLTIWKSADDPESMRVTLRVLAGPYRGREFTFDQHDTFLIGRSDSAHLYLPEDKFFSRHHCLLEIAPPRCFLRDLGSTNGTFVNGKKVPEAHLVSGDRVQGGQTVFEVVVIAIQAVTIEGL